jgi:hypothetical protein
MSKNWNLLKIISICGFAAFKHSMCNNYNNLALQVPNWFFSKKKICEKGQLLAFGLKTVVFSAILHNCKIQIQFLIEV